jgi:hypothetical protein
MERAEIKGTIFNILLIGMGQTVSKSIKIKLIYQLEILRRDVPGNKSRENYYVGNEYG